MKTVVGWGQSLILYESAFLLGMARSLPEKSRVVNIGAGEGISAAALLEGGSKIKDFQLYSVDIESCEREIALLDSLGVNELGRYFPVIADSEAFAKEWNQEDLQLVFVDGSHEYRKTLIDLDLWGEHLEEGGILVIHDYRDPRQKKVTKAVNEWRKNSGAAWSHIGHVFYTVAYRKPGGDGSWKLGRF